MTELSRRTFLYGTGAAATMSALGTTPALAQPQTSGHRLHESILNDARMEWRTLPKNWGDSPFLANGFLGVQIYAGRTPNELKLMLSHSEVQDQRVQWEAAVGLSRLPIGYLTMTFAGAITAVDWTLDLWNAELRGTVTTAQGGAEFRMFVHNSTSTLIADTRGEVTWNFQPLESATTRTIRKPPEYTANPPWTLGAANGVSYAKQTMHAGGGYTTAWQARDGRFAAHVGYSFPQDTHTSDAIREVRHALANPKVEQHRRWWHNYYTRSLVSVPDKLVQRYYWLQLYKMASATRADAPVISEWGPWFPEQGNSWTAVWWNLNVQVSYPVINGSNHHELDAVTATLKKFESNLESNIRPEFRDGKSYAICHPGDRTLRPGPRYCGVPGVAPNDHTGNLLWAMHNVWLGYRHTMDRKVRDEVLLPILGKAVNYYARFLVEGPDGKLHLPETRSPEYANATDTTYDLSLIRWGVTTLLQYAPSDPRAPQWTDIRNRLVPYHRGDQGVLIGANVPLNDSHRHFSHMLWFYPLRELTWDDPANRDLITRTFDHWVSRRNLWAGYSYGAASSMASAMNRPEEALQFLRYFLDRNQVGTNATLTENTFYREGGNLAIESPLVSAQAVLEMLIQSHNGVVRVFPSVSSTWRDASVESLRTQGAFLVDASRSNGATDWVRVHSEAGEPLVLQHGIAGEIDVRDQFGRRLEHRQQAGGTAIKLRRGQTAIVSRKGSRPDLCARDVPANGTAPRWGLP
ncbi:twin-arginine translocation signal domain-containing protein [Lentzea tibetensis]|uniref:Twin-arginine translocation signal domain-containing protein n=1 Tax=Lentzea tibetensis TaxID=2591470 RepID=A0A563ETG3_9PSEU|nr:twin-arginine translocation signal domain-containing protein [Lentzea tibetensis]TWP50882.1 twin-arginine translocation signal domain-containing protein [Lentzea tibetensis]